VAVLPAAAAAASLDAAAGELAVGRRGSPSTLLQLLQLLLGSSLRSSLAAGGDAAHPAAGVFRTQSGPAQMQACNGQGPTAAAAAGAASFAAALAALAPAAVDSVSSQLPQAAVAAAAMATPAAEAAGGSADHGLQFEGLTVDQLTALLRLCKSPGRAVGRTQSVPEVLLSALSRMGAEELG
jgi:hypothetical protein